MFFFGIIAGFGATFFQDLGYVFSRLFIRHGGAPPVLLIATQLLMGIGGVLLLVILLCATGGEWTLHGQILLPLAGSAYGSLGGQLFFFRAEKFIAPARLSALMGLRVVVLVLISALFWQERYNSWQIAAIAAAALAAFVLNFQRGRLEFAGMGSMALTLVCYAVSDLSVTHLLHLAGSGALWQRALLAMALVNTLLALTTLPWVGRCRPTGVRPALPFAGAWFAKQLLLYLCYGCIGPVFGNVIMAFRGILAMFMTALLTRIGVQGLEEAQQPRSFARPLAATLLMTAAIVVYTLA